MGELQRIQVLVKATQHEQLSRLAAAQGSSVSAVIRELIDEGLRERERKKARQLATLERLADMRQAIEANYGVYEGDVVAEGREERMQAMERVWHGES